MKNEFINIKPARGGFVIEYLESKFAPLDTYTSSASVQPIITEVVSNEAKLIKRIREILESYNGPVKLEG